MVLSTRLSISNKADYIYLGLNTAHTYPRASGFLVVVEGTLQSGFILENGLTSPVSATILVSFGLASKRSILILPAILCNRLSSGSHPLPI
jgi:hypothetical protein